MGNECIASDEALLFSRHDGQRLHYFYGVVSLFKTWWAAIALFLWSS